MLARFGSSRSAGKTPLPDGYHLIHGGRSRTPAWVQLLDSSGDFGHADRGVLRREILSTIIPDGAVLVAHGGELVACAAVCFAKRFAPYCLLNYVLVRQDHRGKGIGRAISAEAMKRGRDRGYSGMVLQTDDTRGAAIAMYMSLGFEPALESGPDAPERWKRVLDRLHAGSDPSSEG